MVVLPGLIEEIIMITLRLTKKTLKFWFTILWIYYGIIIIAGISVWFFNSYLVNQFPGLIYVPLGALVLGILSHMYLVAFWKRFYFTYDDRHIRIYSGVWWRKQILIPFNRVTNIEVLQGPWQRRLGLATLKLQTAGQGATNTAESRLWSVPDFESLRDDLQQKALSARQQNVTDGVGAVEPELLNESAFNQMIGLLTKIEENTRLHK